MQVDRLDTINLALVRSIHNDHSIRHSQVKLIHASSPSTSLLQNLGSWCIESVVGPIRPYTFGEHAILIESQITLRGKRAQLPILLSGPTGIFKILSHLGNGTSEGLLVSKLVVGLFGFGSFLRTSAGLALGLGDSLGELLHGGEVEGTSCGRRVVAWA